MVEVLQEIGHTYGIIPELALECLAQIQMIRAEASSGIMNHLGVAEDIDAGSSVANGRRMK